MYKHITFLIFNILHICTMDLSHFGSLSNAYNKVRHLLVTTKSASVLCTITTILLY